MIKLNSIKLSPDLGWTPRVLKVAQSPEVIDMLELANEHTGVIGYTEHGERHAINVAKTAGNILYDLNYDINQIELAIVAGLLHDIGNMISRNIHPETASILTFLLLKEFDFNTRERGLIASAIANHDECNGHPLNPISAVLILADKSDVHRSRVRQESDIQTDIHDKVNFAVIESSLVVHKPSRIITLKLLVDPEYATVMDYFEIFLSRMTMCKTAATFLNCHFNLVINDTLLG